MSAITSDLGGVPGLLTAEAVAQTAAHLASLQRSNGQLVWFPGGHCDPWNHVEVAMALTVTGYRDEARAAYRWLAQRQLGDGSWFNYYRGDAVADARLDTNVCAYVAAGLFHYVLATGDVDFAAEHFAVVDRAIAFVLRWQQDDGTVRWSLDSAGRPESYALLTGSSSIYHSLRCALALAERLDLERPAWAEAAGRLGHAVAHHPGAFAPKNEFAMDWYYPVLSGALTGEPGVRRLRDGWDRHVMSSYGVRCVSTNDWVTAAETAECVIALDALGLTSEALDLFDLTGRHRRDDGAYWTGLAYPGPVTFPDREATSYTAAAVLLAADALTSTSGASALFRHGALAPVVARPEPGCRGVRAGGGPLRPGDGRGAGDRRRRRRSPRRAASSLQDAQRADVVDVVEAVVEGGQVDLVRRSPAVGGVGEDDVDQQAAADGHLGRPRAIVGPRDVVGVPAVDEE